jgi:hypothetical protein
MVETADQTASSKSTHDHQQQPIKHLANEMIKKKRHVQEPLHSYAAHKTSQKCRNQCISDRPTEICNTDELTIPRQWIYPTCEALKPFSVHLLYGCQE